MGKGKLRISKFIHRCSRFLITSIGILQEGFLLGILSNKDLTELTKEYYQSASMYGNDEYNFSGLYPWERRVIDTYFRDCKKVLIGAAGGGREVIALSGLGMEVDAFECDPHLVEDSIHFLDKAGIKGRIVLAPPDTVPEGLGIYDGVVVGWGGYHHIIGRDTRVRFLEQCRKHMKADAPLLVSFFMLHGTTRYQRLIFKIASLFRSLRMNKEPLELGDSLKYTGFCHLFSNDEIEEELNEAGFDLIFFSNDEYSHAVGKAVREMNLIESTMH